MNTLSRPSKCYCLRPMPVSSVGVSPKSSRIVPQTAPRVQEQI